MDLPKPSLSSTRATSATFPLSQTSTRQSQRRERQSNSDISLTQSQSRSGRSGRSEDRQISSRPGPALDPPSYDGARSRHKHSKSRELRFPRPSHLTSASARGLLPTWSGSKDKEREDGLLQVRENGRWGSDSDSRKGSLVENERLGPIQREIQSLGDLERVKKRRKIGEEYLRSALTSIGTLATDVTRRLDYTYYNLLEKITALNSTISSFQELSDSASTLLNDFERETTGLDQDIRKQINDLQGFTPQIEKADALEQRMKAGRQRVEELGKRLETVRHEIDSWEQRETEWQMRTTRRLRIWGIVLGAVVILVVALVCQSQKQNGNQDRNAFRHLQLERLTAFVDHDSVLPWDSGVKTGSDAGPTFPSSLADRRESLANAGPGPGPTSTGSGYDPLRVLNEL